MTEPTSPSELRRKQIAELRTESDRLLNAFKNESVKKLVRVAVRDLDEAEIWLREKDIDSRPVLFGIVDLTIRLARTRLEGMRELLGKFGPDAIAIG